MRPRSEIVEQNVPGVPVEEQTRVARRVITELGQPSADVIVSSTMRLRHFASGAVIPVYRARLVEPDARLVEPRPRTGNGQAARLRRQRERREAKADARAMREVAAAWPIGTTEEYVEPATLEAISAPNDPLMEAAVLRATIAAMGQAALVAQEAADVVPE